MVLAGLAVWAGFLPLTQAAVPWIYSWDSAAYIEAAQSIRAGRGVLQRVFEGLGSNIWMPMSWWPPGYSMLVAGLHWLGLPAPTACIAVAGIKGAFAVVILAVIALRLFHWALALPLTLVVAASVAFQKVSVQCMSDTSFFVFVLASLACLIFWATGPKASMRLIFGAGVFAGAAWATRNAGLALFAATALFHLSLLTALPLRRVLKMGLAWAAGVAVCGLPLVAHNIAVFGKVNPYHMAPSELSLMHNLRRAVQVVVGDLTTSHWLAAAVSGRLVILAVAAGLVLAVAAGLVWRRGITAAAAARLIEANRLQILLLAYAVAYAAIVVMARTKYRWGEEIDPRHMFQIYWPLWVCAALWGRALLARRSWTGGRAVAVLALAFAGGAALQARQLVHYTADPAPRRETMEARVGAQACAYIRERASPRMIVLSTRAEILRVACGANARKIPPIDQYYKLSPISRQQLYDVAERGLLWGVVIEDTDLARRGGLGPMFEDMIDHPENWEGFQRVHPAGPALILEWRGRTPARDA